MPEATIKERPIIMSAESVRAILTGRKTQTRRVCRFKDPTLTYTTIEDGAVYNADHYGDWHQDFGPYGLPGERLWVRETWRPWERPCDLVDGIEFRDPSEFVPIANTPQAAAAWCAVDTRGDAWRSPLFMPRWASRLTLEVVSVRVELVRSISHEDRIAEGVEDGSAVEFARRWDALNAKRGFSWDSNPWVWCVEFRRVEPDGQGGDS